MSRDVLLTIRSDDFERLRRKGTIKENTSEEKRKHYREIVTDLLEELGVPFKVAKRGHEVDTAVIQVKGDRDTEPWNRTLRLDLYTGVSRHTRTPGEYWPTDGSWKSDYAYGNGKPIKGEQYGEKVEYDSLDVLGRLFVRLAGSDWFSGDTIDLSYEGRETEFNIFAHYGIIVLDNNGRVETFHPADTTDENRVIARIRKLDVPREERDK